MGFYGNISNVARTQFSFDKVYSNKKAMDQACLTDGIYLGRYVLIEYDDDGLDGMKEVTIDDGKYYYGKVSDETLLTWKNTVEDEVVYVKAEPKYLFYKRNGKPANVEDTDAATFTQITNGSELPYTRNYTIDQATYQSSRGYDSTVWQKTYANNTEKYVMIAELNTVVPTFAIATDAPTMTPVAPHFDTQSTDVYYKLHLQNPWVVRVAEAQKNEEGKIISDTTTKWIDINYDPEAEVGQQYSTVEVEKDAAIYFNKAAFDAQVNKQETINKKVSGDNKIIMNLVSSGKPLYDDHDNTTSAPVAAKDIQELTINLPAIGNMMSDAWDIIHGDDRKDSTGDDHPSLQGRLNAFSNMQDNTIAIKRSSDGTLVGTQINGNTPRTVTDIKNEKLHTTDYDQDDAWIKTSINTIGLDNTTDLKGIAIHHTFTPTNDTNSVLNKNTDNVKSNNDSDKINLYTPIVDAAGHIVGKNTETVTLPYGFKTIKTNGRSTEVSENATGTPATANIVADNTQDELTINSGNKWIRIDTDASGDSLTIRHDVHNTSSTSSTTDWTQKESDTTIPTVTYEYDKAGHYISQHTENYKLPFGYGKIKGDSGNTAATATYDEVTFTSDDWLTATIDKDKVTYSHDFTAKTDTTSATDKNTATENKNTIALYTPIVDAKGHVVGKNTETITLPYGYKTFTGDSGTTSANNTQDSMNIVGDNWIQTTVSDDKIAITHIGPVSGTNTTATAPTPQFGGTFSFNTYDFDNKGHKYNTTAHTIKIPSITLTDVAANGADVITQLTFTNGTDSKLASTRSNIGALKMTGYEKPTSISTEALSASETLNTGLGKLEYRLEKEVADRTNAINNLNYSETADNTKIITQITQVGGKITSVQRAAAGTLVLGNGYSTAATTPVLTKDDSLNTAFGKIEKSLEDTNTRITNLIGGNNLNDAFDTLQEVSDWLAANDSGADRIIDDIAILKGDTDTNGSVAKSVNDAITQEVTNRNNAISNAINELDVSDSEVLGQYVSAVSETDGKITVSRKNLPTLTSGETNGTVKFNEEEVPVTGLGSAAYMDIEEFENLDERKIVQVGTAFPYYVEVDEGETACLEELFHIVAQLSAKVSKLEDEIKSLTNTDEENTPTE